MYEYERVSNLTAQIEYPIYYDMTAINECIELITNSVHKIDVNGYDDFYRRIANLKYAVFYNQIEYNENPT